MKLQELKSLIETKLNDAQAAVESGDIEKAKGIQAEVPALREKLALMRDLDATRASEREAELDSLKSENAKLKKEAEAPLRPQFAGETPEEDKSSDVIPAVIQMRYGELSAATKAVISDLYGKEYFDKRDLQMKAVVKYLRGIPMSAQEAKSIDPHIGTNVILHPSVIQDEIKSGRSVAEMKVTLLEATLDLGGVLVPEDFRMEVTKRLMGMTFVRGRARVVQTTRDAVEWPRVDGGNSLYTSAVRVTWVSENPASATTAQTNPTFGTDRIPVHTVMARTDFSRNLLEDAGVNLIDLLSGLFAEAMAIDEDARFLTGTGGNVPLGALGARVGAEANPVTGIGSVVSGNATALTADGLIDLVYALHAQYRARAILVAAMATHGAIRKIKDGLGDYLWIRGLAPGQPPSLLNYPFYESENMPAIGANAFPVLFGDWSGYVIADRVGMSIERVADTTTVGTNTVAIFARRRLGGQVVEPWKFQSQKIST